MADFNQQRKLTSSSICYARLYLSDKGTFLVLGCMAKRAARESMVVRLVEAVSLSSLTLGADSLEMNTFYRLSTLGPLDISALRPQKAKTTRHK